MMQHCIKSSNKMVPFPWRSNFRISKWMRLSDKRYPKDVRAVLSSFWSMFPELSVSKERKQFCQSVTYFHSAPKSWKLTVPRFSRSNIPIIKRTTKQKLKLMTKSWRNLIGESCKRHDHVITNNDQKLTSFGIEGRPSPIGKGLLELICRNVSTTILIDPEINR